MGFEGTATASNSIFEVKGGYSIPQHFPGNHYDRFNGAQIDFYDTSTAANATFNIQGAAGDSIADSYARVNFRNTSNAGFATFNNQPGLSGLALSGEIVAGFGGQTSFYNTLIRRPRHRQQLGPKCRVSWRHERYHQLPR